MPLLQSMNPDISLITDVAAAWFSRDTRFETGAHDPTKTGFNLQQLEMSIQKSVDPYFRFDAYIVFGQFGVEIEEAYATTLVAALESAGARRAVPDPVRPHQRHPPPQPGTSSISRSRIGRVFGGEGNRGLGVEL